jgi:16S rRNA (adenine1518-N6/adenine1519-N6)-dimethyltransferase
MVQKEVADRLLARVGDKSYGRVSVLIQSNATVELGFEVSPNAFYPKPRVLSSVIKITPFKRQYDYEILDKTLKLSFLHRRKILKNNLKNIDMITENKINKKGICLNSRPQEVKPDDYITLSKILFS